MISADGWRPYIERQDMLIWRREEPNFGGLFSYKVYGTFSDVTAEDFLRTQIDLEYRKKWDVTARELQVIDTDPSLKKSDNNGIDIIYWETIWPVCYNSCNVLFIFNFIIYCIFIAILEIIYEQRLCISTTMGYR